MTIDHDEIRGWAEARGGKPACVRGTGGRGGRSDVGMIRLDVPTGPEPQLHAHVVVGKADGSAHGGHLLAAHVRPTLEVVLVESPKQLWRTPDAESGLALIDVDTAKPHAVNAALVQET